MGLSIVAPAAGVEPLTVEECVQLSLRNNFEMARAGGALASAGADVTGARSRFLPQLSLGGSWTKAEQEPFFNADIGVLTIPPDEFWSGNASANQLLFDGLGSIATYNAAKDRKVASEQDFRKASQDVVFETERLAFDLLKKQALLSVQEEALNLSEEQLKKTRAMKDLGASTQADVFKAEVDHSNNRLLLLRAQRDVEVARATLASYLGLDPREPLEVINEGQPEAAAAEAELQHAAERALERHPTLLSARSVAEADRQSVRAAKSDRYPALSLFGNYSYSDVFALDPPEDRNTTWNYGARLSYSLFDGLLTKANIRRAESSLVTTQSLLESAERDVLLGVQQATLEFDVTKESIAVAEEAVRSSEEDLRLAEERYKVGEGTILEVIDARVNLTRAKTDRVNALHDHRLALAALRNAIGDAPTPEIPE